MYTCTYMHEITVKKRSYTWLREGRVIGVSLKGGRGINVAIKLWFEIFNIKYKKTVWLHSAILIWNVSIIAWCS